MMNEARKAFQVWLRTMSPPRSMEGDETALATEMEALWGVINRGGISSAEQVEAVFNRVKERALTRTWPTMRELREAVENFRRGPPAAEVNPGLGDPTTQSPHGRRLLEEQVLPRARRWLSLPGLREHGVETLRYWGEEIN